MLPGEPLDIQTRFSRQMTRLVQCNHSPNIVAAQPDWPLGNTLLPVHRPVQFPT